MNDLTFGATLLACFATLIVALVLESTSTPVGTARSAVADSAAAPVTQVRLAGCCDCTTIAQAPNATR